MRRFYLVFLPLCLAACETPPDVTDSPSGKYAEVADITQTGDPDYLTQGCDAQGNPVAQIDKRLKSGLILGQVEKVLTADVGVGEVDFTTRLDSLSATSLTQSYNVDNVTNYSGYTKGATFHVQCTLTGGQTSCVSDGPTNTGSEHTKYADCQFDATPTVTTKLTKGSYTFSNNGPKVEAFKMTLTSRGDLTCGTEKFSGAQIDQSLLTSNDIPSTEFEYCGGTAISMYARITAGKKTLKAVFSERTVAGLTTLSVTSWARGPLVVSPGRLLDPTDLTPLPMFMKFGVGK